MMFPMFTWLLLLPFSLISAVFAVEVAMGLLPARRDFPVGHPGSIAAIIPAHDEEAGIAGTVGALLADAPAGLHVLVVADNCCDQTAGIARAAGAHVIERIDPRHIGKGYALAFARDHLIASPPDIAIVIDADCRITPGGVARLAAVAAGSAAPVQASYLMQGNISASPMVQFSGFAFLLKNLVRQRGLDRIGAPAILTGSGMAFPWAIFAAAPLATGDIVEDLALGIALAEHGQNPVFLPDVTILSDAGSLEATLRQRRRWEHGFLATACSAATPLLTSGRLPLMWLGAHLLVPPLTLLMIIHLALFAGLTVSRFLGGSPLPLLAEALVIGALLLVVALAWFREGRGQMRAMIWLRLPLYMIWKMPVYLAALLRPERHWIRAERTPAQVAEGKEDRPR
jgi:cellulose synthase/poly-beta-1,6-N-acetylglucosamine synthase-like glycosyltransferase